MIPGMGNVLVDEKVLIFFFLKRPFFKGQVIFTECFCGLMIKSYSSFAIFLF